jgi:hypothetical protein
MMRVSRCSSSEAFKSRLCRSALGIAVAVAASAAALQPARATTIVDPSGDFLGTYTGPHNGDLDVLSASAVQDGTSVTLTANLNGAVGTTAGSAYVWGVNRGAGAQLLTFGTPSVGAGVSFDAVAVLFPNLTGAVVTFTGGMASAPVPLAAGSVTSSGSTITAVVPFSMLLTTGFAPANYLYNVWPRVGLATNDQIADFAPNASSFAASVPEPAAWALMILGFAVTGAALRGRKARALA